MKFFEKVTKSGKTVPGNSSPTLLADPSRSRCSLPMLRRREGNAAGEGKRRCSRCLQSLFRSPKLVEKRLQLLRIQFLRHEHSMVADQKSIRPTSSTVFLTARRRSKLRLRGRWRAGSPSYRSRGCWCSERRWTPVWHICFKRKMMKNKRRERKVPWSLAMVR